MTYQSESQVRPGVDQGWGTAAKGWGLFSGIAFAVATVAYLVEATGLIGSPPTYTANPGLIHPGDIVRGSAGRWR